MPTLSRTSESSSVSKWSWYSLRAASITSHSASVKNDLIVSFWSKEKSRTEVCIILIIFSTLISYTKKPPFGGLMCHFVNWSGLLPDLYALEVYFLCRVTTSYQIFNMSSVCNIRLYCNIMRTILFVNISYFGNMCH